MQARFLKFALLTLSLAAAGRHSAFADAATEAQLRTALQTATAQIAQLQDQVANMQASQAPDVATIEALRAQLQARKNAAGAPSAAPNDAAIAALRRQLAAREYDLAKSKTQYQTASHAAGIASADNAALTAQLGTLNAGLDSCRDKNAKLFTIGNQILDAYSHKDDLFGTIADREPLIGIKRVELQNIVQDEQDKLYDNQIISPSAAP